MRKKYIANGKGSYTTMSDPEIEEVYIDYIVIDEQTKHYFTFQTK